MQETCQLTPSFTSEDSLVIRLSINTIGIHHLCKHRVFINCSVLHSSMALPDDLLVLLEPPIEQEHLAHRMIADDWTNYMFKPERKTK